MPANGYPSVGPIQTAKPPGWMSGQAPWNESHEPRMCSQYLVEPSGTSGGGGTGWGVKLGGRRRLIARRYRDEIVVATRGHPVVSAVTLQSGASGDARIEPPMILVESRICGKLLP